MKDSNRYWVGFKYIRGIGTIKMRLLSDFFGDPKTAWNASSAALAHAGLNRSQIDQLIHFRATVNLDEIWDKLIADGVIVCTWEDPEYPDRLKDLFYPPPVLFIRGTVIPQDSCAVAIVGTRRITGYGRKATQDLVEALSQHGVTIISGLARGVDGVAHKAALSSGGRTISVLGSGIDVIYPPEHRNLAEEICMRGCLISDYAPGTQPEALNFPPRNRIISGLANIVVVIEAGLKSGALITTKFAADQGRDVFALPGNIYMGQSKGCNQLIQQGAGVLLNPDDILDSLNLPLLMQSSSQDEQRLDENEIQLLELLSGDPMHIDEVLSRTNGQIGVITATLTMMELKGLICQVGEGRYIALQ